MMPSPVLPAVPPPPSAPPPPPATTNAVLWLHVLAVHTADISAAVAAAAAACTAQNSYRSHVPTRPTRDAPPVCSIMTANHSHVGGVSLQGL